MIIQILEKEDVIKGIKGISQNLLEKTEDITNDLENVASITIHAEINPRRNLQF